MAAVKVNPVIQQFQSIGFELATGTPKWRLLVNSSGQERTGKTDWALRDTPAPIAYVGIDFGHEGVIEKHAKNKLVMRKLIRVPVVATQDRYLPIWQEAQASIVGAIELPAVRTVVIDTGTDIWELLRLAEFGKLNAKGDVKQIYYDINQAYKSLIKSAYDRDINLIVIHKSKKRYVSKTINTNKGPVTQDVWEGDYERAGFAEGGYLIQVEIEHLFDGKRTDAKGRKLPLGQQFGIRVLNCRQNMDIAGIELWGPDASFKSLAQYVFPDSSEEDWA